MYNLYNLNISALVRQPLNAHLTVGNVHKGDSRHLAHAATQFAIASRHNVALVTLYPFNDAVVCVCALVCALESLKARIACNA